MKSFGEMKTNSAKKKSNQKFQEKMHAERQYIIVLQQLAADMKNMYLAMIM